jgi:hypothetical protein
MRNLYQTERQALVTGEEEAEDDKLPPSDIQFDVHVEIDIKQVRSLKTEVGWRLMIKIFQVYRHIQRALAGYQQEKKGSTIL